VAASNPPPITSSVENHSFRFEGILNTNLQENRRSSHDCWQIKSHLSPQFPLPINRFGIFHGGRFTTVAEAALLIGVAEAMHEHSKIVLQLKQVLISGAEKVELNPQPLPP
jgi:hypothetical protein